MTAAPVEFSPRERELVAQVLIEKYRVHELEQELAHVISALDEMVVKVRQSLRDFILSTCEAWIESGIACREQVDALRDQWLQQIEEVGK